MRFFQNNNINLFKKPDRKNNLFDFIKHVQLLLIKKRHFKIKSEAIKSFNEIPAPKAYPLIGNLLELKLFGKYTLNNTVSALIMDHH